MNTPEREQRLERLFEAGGAIPPEERGAWLVQVAGDDPELLEELASLLRACDESSRFLATPPWQRLDPTQTSAIPGRIGSFRIVRELGAGGMGVVYLAEQDRPRRRVALKVLRPGAVSGHALQRFEREAELLGRLQHPGIAQVFEAGTTDWGSGPQPYIAMEFVDGPDLRAHVENAGLGTRARVELLTQLCDALEHAHRRGIVHRDVKPTNILVDTSQPRGRIKVLDFGIARATDSDVRATSARTDAGQVLGTLAYMSPEQAGGDPDAIDARSDVYAIGVVGYELLCGRLPLEVAGRPLLEAVRIVRDEEPTPISRVNRVLRGDLETIFSKALEKAPARRYESAAALAADLRRHLDDRPIVARPPSTSYRLSKFARRNRLVVTGAACAFGALLLGLAGTAWQAVEAADQRDIARESLADEEAARVAALAALERESRASEWYRDLLERAAPEAEGRDARLVTVLDRACAELPGRLAGLPDVEAEVRSTVGRTYARLGRMPEAERELRGALSLYPARMETRILETRGVLGQVLVARDRDLGEAEEHLRAAFDGLAAAADPGNVLVPELAGSLGTLALRAGRTAEAEALLMRALADRGDRPSPETVSYQLALGGLLSGLGRFEEARGIEEAAHAAALDIHGPRHPTTLAATANLAGTLVGMGDLERALPLMREALEIGITVQGEEHPDSIARMNDLALALKRARQFDDAQALYERVVAILHEHFGPDNTRTLTAEANLATLLAGRGRLAEGEELHREVLARMLAQYGPKDERTIGQQYNLAWTIGQEERFEESLVMLREVINAAAENLGPDRYERWFYVRVLGSLLEAMGRCAEAIPELELARENLARILGAEHAATRAAANALERCRSATGR